MVAGDSPSARREADTSTGSPEGGSRGEARRRVSFVSPVGSCGRRCKHGVHCSHVGPPRDARRWSVHGDMAVSLSTRCSKEVSKHGDMVTDDGGSSPSPPVVVAALCHTTS
jgi:hypothetical protein